MSIVRARPGILLVGQKLKPVAWNSEAFQILAFNGSDVRERRATASAGELIMSKLLVRGPGTSVQLAEQVQSGKRKYVCRAFQLDAQNTSGEAMSVVILKRPPVADMTLRRKLAEFHLTEREMQVSELLVQGMTNKEIASHLEISENTVKAFLRLIMAKMEMTTRAGVVGKIVGTHESSRERESSRGSRGNGELKFENGHAAFMNGIALMGFKRRRNEGGDIDSVCIQCLETVATRSSEAELKDPETSHECSPGE